MITLTLTSCKRPALFKETVGSFGDCCLDKELISQVLWADDNSEAELLNEGRKEISSILPNVPLVTFHQGSPLKGLANSLNWLFNRTDTRYIFHLEDDWKFIKSGHFIRDGIDIIEDSDHIRSVLARGFTWLPRLETPNKHLPYHSITHGRDSMGHNWYYPYSLNPAVQDVTAYRAYGAFMPFGTEMSFAKKAYEDGLRMVSLTEDFVEHIGEGMSSFQLNGTPR